MNPLLCIAIGLAGGFLGGLFGLGGGAIMVPAMVYFLGLSQHQAQGTSLAIMLPPVGLLAVMRYYYGGNVKIDVAAFAAIGFVFGALLGAHMIQGVADPNLKKAFGIVLIVLGIKIALGK